MPDAVVDERDRSTAGFAIGMTLISRIAPVRWVVTIAIGVIAWRTVDQTLRGGG